RAVVAFRVEFSQNSAFAAAKPSCSGRPVMALPRSRGMNWQLAGQFEPRAGGSSAARRQATLLLVNLLVLISVVSCGRVGRPDDAAITTDIKAKMFSEPALKAANVDVSSHGGQVTLTGQVADDSARLAAYKIASEAKGVTKVNDQMTVLA